MSRLSCRKCPHPKHFPGADRKTPVADAEETHHDPVQKEAGTECDAEHFPVSQQLLEPSRAPFLNHCSFQPTPLCRGTSGANNATHQPGTDRCGGRAKGTRMRIHQGCREDDAACPAYKQHLQRDQCHGLSIPLPTHHQDLLCTFLRQMCLLWKAAGDLGCLEAQLQSLLL